MITQLAIFREGGADKKKLKLGVYEVVNLS